LSPSIVPPCVNFVIVNPHSVVSIHCSSLCQFCHNQFYYVWRRAVLMVIDT
jgi:hypothetical protein